MRRAVSSSWGARWRSGILVVAALSWIINACAPQPAPAAATSAPAAATAPAKPTEAPAKPAAAPATSAAAPAASPSRNDRAGRCSQAD